MKQSPIRSRRQPRTLLASIVAFLVAFLGGCNAPPPTGHSPETVGVVKARTLVGKDLRFEFSDGRTFTSPANFDYVGGSQPSVGDLLLAGTAPELWVVRASPERPMPPVDPVCYALFGKTRLVGNKIYKTVDAVSGTFTLALDRAQGWKDVGRNGDELVGARTCINAAGQAFEQRPASAEG